MQIISTLQKCISSYKYGNSTYVHIFVKNIKSGADIMIEQIKIATGDTRIPY